MLNVRVLVLSKRKYMGRDLIADRYGRFRELPLALSRHGAIVHGLCLGYRGGDEVSVLDESHGGRVDWDASKLSRLLPLGSGSYRRRIDGIAETFRPNLVWACSDTLHATLGAWAARRLGARLVVDLYDNFESYPLHRMPGMNALLRRALRRARAVTCVSEPLAEKVRDEYAVTAAVETIGNAVPDGLFIPQDKSACRRRLGLPDDACIIGTAGAISATRGLGALLDAFRVLRQSRSDLHLVLAGPDDGSLPVPVDDAHVHRLGSLPPADVPYVVGAMDLSVVCNADSAFGRYCFPQKLYESLACRVPVVVADVGAMSRLLSEHREVLFSPEDAEGLARLVEQRLRDPVVPDLPVPTWDTEGARLLAVMQRALKV